MTPSEKAAELKALLGCARERVRALHLSGASGAAVVAEWTREVDRILVPAFASLVREQGLPPGQISLFGLGGYGRKELCPYSDLDLLILHGGKTPITEFTESFLYPLWDAGIDVQCVARTLEENLEVARKDHRSRTSLLDARCVWEGGTSTLPFSERFEREILVGEIHGHCVKEFVQAKISEMETRHQRYGGTVYLLEPNVKEGAGGLRDIQTALWVSMVRFKVRSMAELSAKGLIPGSEIAALEVSRDFLLRIRNDLHLSASRREDHLTFEDQDRIAAWLGLPEDAEVPAGERLLQQYYSSANRVGHFATTVIRRASAGLLARPKSERSSSQHLVPGVTIRAGELHVRRDAVESMPLLLVEAFEVAQAQDVDLSPEAMEVVRENLSRVDDRFRRDPRAVQAFLRILKAPRRVATTLVRMHDVHFLDRFIPEFGHIFCRIQRDLYHVYPVDVHSLFTVQELRRLARGEGAEEFPLLTSLVQEVQMPHILYLAALIHDVGKGYGGGHEQRGAEIAVTVADRMGLTPGERERLVFLVANHLLLAHTAQGRDLHDEDLILDFARRVGDLESLQMLYLLTFADIRAMGPGGWTSWKDLLFRELYDKSKAVLEKGTFEKELAEERVRDVDRRLRKGAAGLDPAPSPEDVETFIAFSDGAPYLLAYAVDDLLRHLQAFTKRAESPAVEIRHMPSEGYSEILLVTRDRPGLFAAVAGLMAAHRLNILSAALNTRADGWVLDVLHVCGANGEVVSEEGRWRAWREDLSGVVNDRLSLEEAVGTRLRSKSGLRRWKPGVPARVRVDNEASRRFTVVDITAADRLGLLYDVASTLARNRLSIRLAKIATNLDQVSDSFYVEAEETGKLVGAREIEELKSALRSVLVNGESS